MAIARHWRLSANLDRWLPRLSLKDSDEPNGAGEDAPADSDELKPVAKAQLRAASWPGILDYGPPDAFLRDTRHGWLRHEPAPNDLGSFDMPDSDVAPGTGVMEGIASALRVAAPPGVTVSVTGFEQVQAVGGSTGSVGPSVLVESLIADVTVLAGPGLGTAVDYSLLLITRWREEREAGRSNEEAILAASPTAGRTTPPPARVWLSHRR